MNYSTFLGCVFSKILGGSCISFVLGSREARYADTIPVIIARSSLLGSIFRKIINITERTQMTNASESVERKKEGISVLGVNYVNGYPYVLLVKAFCSRNEVI